MRRERRRYYAVMLMLIFVCGIVLTACQGGLTGGEKGQNQEVQKEFFAMDTYMTFSLYGEKAGETLKDAEAKIRKLESEWIRHESKQRDLSSQSQQWKSGHIKRRYR